MRNRHCVDLLSRDKGCTYDADEEAHDGEARSVLDGDCSNEDHAATPYHHHALKNPGSKLFADACMSRDETKRVMDVFVTKLMNGVQVCES